MLQTSTREFLIITSFLSNSRLLHVKFETKFLMIPDMRIIPLISSYIYNMLLLIYVDTLIIAYIYYLSMTISHIGTPWDENLSSYSVIILPSFKWDE